MAISRILSLIFPNIKKLHFPFHANKKLSFEFRCRFFGLYIAAIQ